MSVLKKEYNIALVRWNKSKTFMDGLASQEEKDKWLPEFGEMLKTINKLISQIEQAGHKMTEIEIIEGFKEA